MSGTPRNLTWRDLNNHPPCRNKVGIYIIRCANHIYVGQSHNLPQRLRQHFNASYYGTGGNKQTKPLYDAIRTNGLYKTFITIYDNPANGYGLGNDTINQFLQTWQPRQEKNAADVQLDVAEILWIFKFAQQGSRTLVNVSMGGSAVRSWERADLKAQGLDNKLPIILTNTMTPQQAAKFLVMDKKQQLESLQELRRVFRFIMTDDWKQVVAELPNKDTITCKDTFQQFFTKNGLTFTELMVAYFASKERESGAQWNRLCNIIKGQFLKPHIAALQKYYKMKGYNTTVFSHFDLWDFVDASQNPTTYLAKIIRNIVSSVTKAAEKQKRQFDLQEILNAIRKQKFEPINFFAATNLDDLINFNQIRTRKDGKAVNWQAALYRSGTITGGDGSDDITDFKKWFSLIFFNERYKHKNSWNSIKDKEEMTKKNVRQEDGRRYKMYHLPSEYTLSHRMKLQYERYKLTFATNQWLLFYKTMVDVWRRETYRPAFEEEEDDKGKVHYLAIYPQITLIYGTTGITQTGLQKVKALKVY